MNENQFNTIERLFRELNIEREDRKDLLEKVRKSDFRIGQLLLEMEQAMKDATVALCDCCDRRPGNRMIIACGVETWICDVCSGVETESAAGPVPSADADRQADKLPVSPAGGFFTLCALTPRGEAKLPEIEALLAPLLGRESH